MTTSKGGRPQGPPTRTATYRIPVDLADRLAAEADARLVSINWLVVRLLERGLDALTDPLAQEHRA